MPMILKSPSIAAGATNENLISGSAFEFPRARGVASMGVVAVAAGVICNIQAGGDIIAEAFELPIKATYPIIPDDVYFTDAIEVGDRIVQRVQNTTAGAIVVRSLTQISYA